MNKTTITKEKDKIVNESKRRILFESVEDGPGLLALFYDTLNQCILYFAPSNHMLTRVCEREGKMAPSTQFSPENLHEKWQYSIHICLCSLLWYFDSLYVLYLMNFQGIEYGISEKLQISCQKLCSRDYLKIYLRMTTNFDENPCLSLNRVENAA